LLQLRHVKTMSGFAAASSREVAVVRIHDAHSYLHCVSRLVGRRQCCSAAFVALTVSRRRVDGPSSG
jgi:hypothetical protein